jgi:tetratricopeptide (TPR) repeat protein
MITRRQQPDVPALVEGALADPAGFLSRDEDQRGERRSPRDSGEDAVIHGWARGLALRELGRLEPARDELVRAADRADAQGDPALAGTIRSSLAAVLLHLGATDQALEVAGEAAEVLTGAAGARNRMQLGFILQRLGRQREAEATYDAALEELEAVGDRAATARLLSNRGILKAYVGDLRTARSDIERSIALARDLGNTRAVAFGLQNLGFVAGRAGDVPTALRAFEEADGMLRAMDDGAAARASLDLDRAAVLADAGLLGEAIERADAAARIHARSGDRTNLAEAQLLGARLRFVDGQLDVAAELADTAAERFTSDGRGLWALQARYVAAAARIRAGSSSTEVVAGALAAELQAGGWPTEAREVRLLGAQQAMRDGSVAEARRLLGEVGEPPRTAPAVARAQHRLATAMVRLADGDDRGARRAISAGLDVLQRSRTAFGSVELRAHAARHTAELVDLGVRLELQERRPISALRLVDRERSTDLQAPPTPPADERLAADLAELRALHSRELEGVRAGEDVRRLARDRARLERRIRDRARTVADGEDRARIDRLDVAELRRALAGRTLASYLELDGDLHLLAVSPRSTDHRLLGPADVIRAEVEFLRASLRRLGSGRGSTGSLDAAAASMDRCIRSIIQTLGLDKLETDGLVVVPSASLNGLPWAALVPSVEHVPIVATSAATWLAAARRPSDAGSTRPTLLVAGPRLPGAEAEVLDLAASASEDTQVLSGANASVAAVLSGLETSGCAHIAAHGTFRADNPLFSTIELADGPLTVHELGALRSVPRRLVLSSCDAAAASVLAGDAVLGLSSELVRLGVSCVIAPTLPIPDAATRPLMLDLHRALAAGRSPASALAWVIQQGDGQPPADRAVRASFLVLGRDEA